MHISRAALLLTIGLAIATSATAQTPQRASEDNGAPSRSAKAHPTGRLLVKWRQDEVRKTNASGRLQKAAGIAGFKLRSAGGSHDGYEALEITQRTSVRDLETAAARLESDDSVEYASVEYRRKAHRLTSDTLLAEQWYLLSAQPAATRTDNAWDTTEGNASVVVAVLDTGVRFDHPDIGIVGADGTGGGKFLPGYDFVSSTLVANDSNGRDSDASDPGDWVSLADVNQNPNDAFDDDCLSDSGQPVNSSWHGTRVSGLIAAHTNNGAGIAGNAWSTLILPVRVLGKCGGADQDIIDGMRWAAGLPVAGVPNNPNPAKIINLSLGGEGACTTAYQTAINQVTAAGSLVVASAGNEGTQVSAPANCQGVLGVAGLRHIGTKVGFSNLGPQVGIGAPGGNCVNINAGPCLFSIVVATNNGAQAPGTHGYTDQLNFNVGTSFSAPMAASAAALLRAVNSTLTPPQIVLLLKDSATPYPANPAVQSCTIPTSISAPQDEECNCTTETCGAGMLNTGAAIAAALRPLAVVETNGTVTVGSTLTLNGSGSFAGQGHTLVSHQWSVLNTTGTAPTIANATAASTTLQLTGVTQFTLRLTVTDEQGAQDTKDIALATPAAPPVTPAPTPPASGISGNTGGGGGGGSLGWELLALVAFAAATRRRRVLQPA